MSTNDIRSLESIRSEIAGIARKLGVSSSMVPKVDDHEGEYPDVTWMRMTESDPAPVYQLLLTERRDTRVLRESSNPDEIVEAAVLSMVHELASNFELAHRKPNEDSRRQLFEQIVERLDAIRPAWAYNELVRQSEILMKHPFRDRQ